MTERSSAGIESAVATAPQEGDWYDGYRAGFRDAQKVIRHDAQPSRNSALEALAGLFSESAHETWTKDEIVNIIKDAIRLGSPPSSTERP